MISIDTNILVALLTPGMAEQTEVAETLMKLRGEDELSICGCVYGELMAGQRSAAELDRFFAGTGISIDWEMGEAVFRSAGLAFKKYVERRQGKNKEEVRRILTDFLIGAHAQVTGSAILTLDKRIFRAAFPDVPLLRML